jgi:hypothetical protein
MGVQEELLARVVFVCLVNTEYFRAFGVKGPFSHEVINGPPGQKCRVQLKKRLWPKCSLLKGIFDFFTDARVCDFDETARIASVIPDETIPKIKNVHQFPLWLL